MRVYLVLVLILVLLHSSIQTKASIVKVSFPLSSDTLLRKEILKVLADKTNLQAFNYPKSVTRFYSQSDFQPIWVTAEKDKENLGGFIDAGLCASIWFESPRLSS